MEDYQQSLVDQFFSPLSSLTEESCCRFALEKLSPVMWPGGHDKISIRPSSFQGSMSFTIIVHRASIDESIVVQFRSEEEDLSGVTEAHRIHGPLAPLVTYRGKYEDLFVYSSPFSPGTPYIEVLTSSKDLTLTHKTATILDLADIISRDAKRHTQDPDTCLLNSIQSGIGGYIFQLPNLHSAIYTCIDHLRPRMQELTILPLSLSHQDLSSFNYLIDDSTGRITTVLDWSGAQYQPLGSNFHFVEDLLGYMTPTGWTYDEDRNTLEDSFYTRICENLQQQHINSVNRELLEPQKAIGLLQYYLERLLKLKDKRTELYLDGYLSGLTFMTQAYNVE
ncbi:hypothetical protein BT63DRAFT_291354 [Microthyrium microscopicum]|uniref:Uncharacterized protein n=1 Tax=Microthyrium microscopicum TaxID=703497 RepID=A0A6A6U545_9PEZI|nr:hypothetical protein BT63DRAFT_291354 [Microthyrium microscopicum]